jgi:hypothetical protein
MVITVQKRKENIGELVKLKENAHGLENISVNTMENWFARLGLTSELKKVNVMELSGKIIAFGIKVKIIGLEN